MPLYEINQIIHAHASQSGAVLDWAYYETNNELAEAFEQMKREWEAKQ